MIPVPSYLANFQCVIDAFSYWPGFHDSPVLRFESGDDAIELELEAWETSDEVDEGGYFKLIKKHGIGFRFSGLVSKDLERFEPSNILFCLGFSPQADFEREGYFTVELDSAISGDGGFCARRGEVTFVRALE